MTKQSFIWAFLCISLSQMRASALLTKPFLPNYEDDYYYVQSTSITTMYVIYEQDKIDAAYIIKGGLEAYAYAGVLSYRTKTRCMSISREIATLNGEEYTFDLYVPGRVGVTRDYFLDLVFAMAHHEIVVLGAFLEPFFEHKDETWINIAMTLCKDIQQMISIYDKYHPYTTFKYLRKKQRSPYEHMLRVWVKESREPAEDGDPDPKQVSEDVTKLRSEHENGCWTENRDVIENILMKKSVKYAKKVIEEFEKQLGDKKFLKDVIANCMNSDKLHDIGDAYVSLVVYIKDKHQYISDILFYHSEGENKWSVWAMCIAVNEPKEWQMVDKIFQSDHKQTLTQFIKDKLYTDDYVDARVQAEMITVIVNPGFKPTTFDKLELTPGASPDPSLSPAPPPAPPSPSSSP